MKFLLRISLSLLVATTAVVAAQHDSQAPEQQQQQQQQRHNTSPTKHCASRGQSCRSSSCCSGFQCDSIERICKLKASDRCSRSSDCCSPNTCQSGYCRPPKTSPSPQYPNQPSNRCGRVAGQSCSVTSKTSCCKTGTCSGGICCVATGLRGCRSKSDCCSYGDTCDNGVCKKKNSGGGPTYPQPQCYSGLGQQCKAGTALSLSRLSNKPSCCKVGTCGVNNKCCLNTGASGCSSDSHCCTYGDKCDRGLCKKKGSGPTEPTCTAVLGDQCKAGNLGGLSLSSSSSRPSCCKVGTCGTKNTCCLNTEASGCTLDKHCCKDGDKCTGGVCKTPVTPPVCSDLRGSCSNGGCCKTGLTCGTEGTCCVKSSGLGCNTKQDCCDASDNCVSNICQPPPQCSALNGRCSDILSTGSCCQEGLTCFQSRCCVATTKTGCKVSTDCCTEGDTCESGVCTASPQCSDLNGVCSTESNSNTCCKEGLTCSGARCCVATTKPGCKVSTDCCTEGDTCESGVCTAPPVCSDLNGQCSTTPNSGTCCKEGLTCSGSRCCVDTTKQGCSVKGDCCNSNDNCVSGVCTAPPQCTTGSIQCCQKVTTAKDPVAGLIISLLGIVVRDLDTVVGLTCSPITSIGGNLCNASPVCCENNSFNGLIAIKCTPVTL